MTKVTAIYCKSCKDTVWSRHRHDMRWCKCGNCAIDGGRSYTKISAKPEAKYNICIRDVDLDND